MSSTTSIALPPAAARELVRRADAAGVSPGRAAAEIVAAELGAEMPRPRRSNGHTSAEAVRACDVRGGATIADVMRATRASYHTARLRLNRAAAGGLLRKTPKRGRRPARYAPTDLGRRVAGMDR